MSSLLMLALFFKFNRFWSVRNFDLLLIILLAPGLLMIDTGSRPVATPAAENKFETAPFETPDSETPPTAETEQTNDTVVATPKLGEQADAVKAKEIEPETKRVQRLGYIWIFSVGLIF